MILKLTLRIKPQHVNVLKIPLNALISFLREGVITKCEKEQNDFIPTVSTREKKDGTFRTILNLKYVNELQNINTLKWNLLKVSLKL